MTKKEIIKLYINDLFALVKNIPARNARIAMLKEELEKENNKNEVLEDIEQLKEENLQLKLDKEDLLQLVEFYKNLIKDVNKTSEEGERARNMVAKDHGKRAMSLLAKMMWGDYDRV